MIHALRAEVRRLISRRLTLFALLALVALIGLFQLSVADQVSPPSASDRQFAEERAAEDLVEWEANHERWERECRNSGGSDYDCAMPAPTVEDWLDGPYPFDEAAMSAVFFGVALSAIGAFVVAASFVGAEFGTGSMANWLTFLPRRSTVFVSKLTVVATGSLLLGLATGGLTLAASVIITLAFGQPLIGFDEVAQMAFRGAIITLIGGVLGFGGAMLTGSTVAAIGILIGGMFGVFVLQIVAYGTGWVARLSPWSPDLNAQAIVQNGAKYWIPRPGTSWADESEGIERQLSLAHGLGYWAVVLAVVIAVSWLVFRRRDFA